MADKKNAPEKKEYPDEEKLGKLVDKVHIELSEEMKSRPYLIVVASGYELEKKGEFSTLAAQWAWRSNVFVGKEEGKKIMEFLTSQLKGAVEDQDHGIKKQYKI